MKIYIAHSNSFDYGNDLYKPVRSSDISRTYDITFPYEFNKEPVNSKEFIKECNLVMAEVSYPSIGLGLELGWADIYQVPVVCFYKKGSHISRSLKVITNNFIEYTDQKDMIHKLTDYLKTFKNP